MTDPIRNRLRLVALFVAVTVLGLATGAASRGEIAVAAACEEDECEGGKNCEDNTGNLTECPKDAAGNCDTKVCSGGGGGQS